MANPAVTEPGGTSRITAEVVNPDSIPLTFSWVASGGSISGAEAQALWVAPQSTGEFTISVVIKDSKGRTASGSIGVYVQAPSSSKPAPTPTPTAPKITTLTADPTVTEPSGTSSITAEVANPDNVPLTFSWVASGGSITGAQAQALWVAPQSTGEFTISVIAKDSYGRTASGSIGVNVQASSPAPAPIPSPTGTRDPFMWPFASTSPWNYPIGSGAVYSTMTGNWDLSQINPYFNADQFTPPVYKATSSDPLRNVTVQASSWNPGLNIPNPDPDNPNFCQSGPIPTTYQFRIPANAVASPPPYPSDASMIVVDPDGKTIYELFGARKAANGVDWLVLGFVRNDITRMGAGFPCWHSTRASGTSNMGGLSRAGELRNGIKHALAIAVAPSRMNKNGPNGKSWVWPASGSDPTTSYATVGNVYMGSLLAIPRSVELDALPFQTVEGKNVARALQLYGAYIIDGHGGGSSAVVFVQEYTARAEMPLQTSSSPFIQDLRLAGQLLKVISNNGPNSIGGGGTPLAPPAPPLAQLRSSGGHDTDVLASNPRRTPDTSIPLAASVVALLPLGHLRQTRRNRNSVTRHSAQGGWLRTPHAGD